MDKSINNRAILGGCLGFVSYFLPWVSVAFILGSNLSTLASNGARVFYLELLAALALLVFGVLVPRLGKLANALIVFASLVGVAFLLHIFFQEFFTALAIDKGAQQWGGFLLLGVGFWLAAVGFIASLVGGIKGLTQ
jgi:hypothetical protein